MNCHTHTDRIVIAIPFASLSSMTSMLLSWSVCIQSFTPISSRLSFRLSHNQGKTLRNLAADITHRNGNAMDNRLCNLIVKSSGRHTDRLTGRHTDRPTGGHTDRMDDLIYWNCIDQLVYELLWLVCEFSYSMKSGQLLISLVYFI